MGERFPGSGGVQASCPSAKGHPKKEITLQKTPIYGAEQGEGEAESQGTGGRRTWRQTLGTNRVLNCRSRPEGGGSGRVDDGGRKR